MPVIINDSATFKAGNGTTLNFDGGVTSTSPVFDPINYDVYYNLRLDASTGFGGITNFNAPISGGIRLIGGGNQNAEFNLNVANTFTGGVQMDGGNKGKLRLNAPGAFPGGELMLQRGGYLEVNAENAITGDAFGGSNTGTSVFIGGQYVTNDAISIGHFYYANNYTGATRVDRSTAELWLHNATGSATGTDAVLVRGLLGGTGQIITANRPVQFRATYEGASTSDPDHPQTAGYKYARLSPGDAPGLIGTLRINIDSNPPKVTPGTVDLRPAIGWNDSGVDPHIPGVHNMMFDLGAPGNSDKVSLLGTTVLQIANGFLQFDDFAFTPTSSFAGGAITLFDSSTAISGTLGVNVSGTIGTNGRPAALGISGDGQDLLLNAAINGDLNFDGMVDGVDLSLLGANWQGTGNWGQGDINADGAINGVDLSMLGANWQAGVSQPLNVGFAEAAGEMGLSVPEPASLAALGVGTLAFGLRRRRA